MTDSVRGWALAISLVAGFSAACGGGATKEPQTANSAREDDPGLRDYIVSKGGVGPYTNGEGSAAPAPDAFRLELLDKDRPIKFDGVVQEWPARFPVKQPIQGVSKASLSVSVQYDDAKVYVGGEVSDETFVRTARFGDAEDHASLILSIPSASGASVAYEVGFYAGKPGDSAGSVRYLSGGHKGQVVPDSKIVEAPIAGGYSFEAAFPWAALPEAVRVRVGMHGAARYYDIDAPGGAAAIVATGPGDASSPAALPPLPTESEQSLVE